MIDLLRGALELQDFCEQEGWQYCFIGGLAVQRWGYTRVTNDADLTLLTGFGSEEKYIDRLLSRFEGRVDDARELALRRRVLLLRSNAEVPFDISLGALPFEEAAIGRSSLWTLEPGKFLRTCSAEDLIVFKVIASRGQDWVDVENVLGRHGKTLGGGLIIRELGPLVELKEEPELLDRLRGLFKKFGVQE